MKFIQFAISLCLAFGASACVGASTPEPLPRYSFQIEDNPDQRRFDLAIVSEDSRLLCVYVDYWPNPLGELDEGSVRSSLESDSGVLAGKDGVFGYAPTGWPVFVIVPSSSLSGFISYSSFGDPDTISKLVNRRLIFSVGPEVCTRSMLKKRFKG